MRRPPVEKTRHHFLWTTNCRVTPQKHITDNTRFDIIDKTYDISNIRYAISNIRYDTSNTKYDASDTHM